MFYNRDMYILLIILLIVTTLTIKKSLSYIQRSFYFEILSNTLTNTTTFSTGKREKIVLSNTDIIGLLSRKFIALSSSRWWFQIRLPQYVFFLNEFKEITPEYNLESFKVHMFSAETISVHYILIYKRYSPLYTFLWLTILSLKWSYTGNFIYFIERQIN